MTGMKRLNLHIQAESRDRLSNYCYATGQEPGRVLERLIETLERWVLWKEPDDELDRSAGAMLSNPARNPAPRRVGSGPM
jgi:hypothetical protein